MATDFVAERAEAATSIPGVLGTSGVEALRTTLRSAETAKPFAQWANEQFTRLVRRAIRDLALHGTVPSPSDPAIAYGISCGLQLAARLMEDPSAVFSDVFSSGNGVSKTVSLDQIRETFAVAPDEL